MANVPDYVVYLLNKEQIAGNILGVNVMLTDREKYVINLINATMFGWLIKALVDNHILTEAQLDQTMQVVMNGDWPAWVLDPMNNPPPPPT